MESVIINNNIIALLLDEDNEDTIISELEPTKKSLTDKIFKNRSSEGFFEILVNRHLKNNEIKFCKFHISSLIGLFL